MLVTVMMSVAGMTRMVVAVMSIVMGMKVF